MPDYNADKLRSYGYGLPLTNGVTAGQVTIIVILPRIVKATVGLAVTGGGTGGGGESASNEWMGLECCECLLFPTLDANKPLAWRSEIRLDCLLWTGWTPGTGLPCGKCFEVTNTGTRKAQVTVRNCRPVQQHGGLDLDAGVFRQHR
ncbi:hypothetical protein NC652_030415 [Populus alba x Populus x berolinensis]|nr:hypothetical protein NC652_030415 [Populus alba x Populus x berolinensis]